MKKILSIITIIALLCGVIPFSSASAANVCYDISGNLNSTTKFEVTTGGKLFSSEKIVITQSKGTILRRKFGSSNGTWSFSEYGCFNVKVKDNKTGKTVYSKTHWKGNKLTIPSSRLKRNRAYSVIIEGIPYDFVGSGYTTVKYKFIKWEKPASWRVTKTGGNILVCNPGIIK